MDLLQQVRILPSFNRLDSSNNTISFFTFRKYSDYSDATTSDWTDILKIACENCFLEVQHCAIRGLQACDLTTVERISIYEMYRAEKRYIAPLYAEMAMRDQSPNKAEEEKLGDKTTLLIFRLREHLRSRPVTTFNDVSPLPAGIDDDDALHVVCEFLGIDPARVPPLGARVMLSCGVRHFSNTDHFF